MEKLLNEIGTFFGGLLAGLIISGVRIFKVWYDEKRKRKKSSIKYQFKEFAEIHEKLTELRKFTECNRAVIYQFHNGEYYTSNNSMLKASMTYESCDETTKSFFSESQGLQASLFFPIFKEIFENHKKMVIINEDDESSELSSIQMKKFLLYRGIATFVSTPIIGKNEEVVGILKLEYNKNYKISPEEEKELLSYANIVSYIFNKN